MNPIPASSLSASCRPSCVLAHAFRPLSPAFENDLAGLEAVGLETSHVKATDVEATGFDMHWLRDIAWLLHAPDMATSGYSGRPTLDELGLASPRQRREWFTMLAADSDAFIQHMAKRPTARLGLYHETLWQWILVRAPATRLIAHNIALREAGQTLGELDLLYAQRYAGDKSSTAEHAELAIKFFLGLSEGPGNELDPARWIGVGSFDSLAIKCHRLRTHQLPMGQSPAAKAWLSHHASDGPLHQRSIMPGCLYHPWRQRLMLPRATSANCLQGIWCTHADWLELVAALPRGTQGEVLHKPHWLAPPAKPAQALDTLTQALRQHFEESHAPRHLYLQRLDGYGCRVFVVKDDWPKMLPLPPAVDTATSLA